MTSTLPNCDERLIRCELRRLRPADREDAVQEAWVARLEGRCPVQAINTFAHRLARRRKRELTGLLNDRRTD